MVMDLRSKKRRLPLLTVFKHHPAYFRFRDASLVEGIRYVLGIDGGGSGTRCVIAHVSGRLLAKGSGGPSNPLTVGAGTAAEAIIEAVDEASRRCGIRQFQAACMGIAGTDRTSGREALREKLSDLSVGQLSIISDAEAALAGATGCRPGVVVIAGTGSIAYGVNEKGETARAGGWGWMLGDEGSGYDIGRKALTAALRAYDGRNPNTSLIRKLRSTLGLEDMSELIDRIYIGGMDIKEIANLATLVCEAASEGDKTAIKILEEAGKELGIAALSVIHRLKLRGEFNIALTGGVFNLGGPLRTSFEDVVNQRVVGCHIDSPRFEPAVGSALIALQKLGVKVDEGLLGRVEASHYNLKEDS